MSLMQKPDIVAIWITQRSFPRGSRIFKLDPGEMHSQKYNLPGQHKVKAKG